VSEPEHAAPHDISLAVWDLASPVVAGRRATLKVGITCSSGCDLSGSYVDVYDGTRTKVGAARIASALWPGTDALYWAELDIAAPSAEGDHAWTIEGIAVAPSHLAPSHLAPSHERVVSVVRFAAVRPPEHRVTVEVIEKDAGVPMAGVELRLGPFRATTNKAGVAYLHVPGDTYDLCAWKIGYDMLSTTASIATDTTLRLEVMTAPEPEQPYWA